MSYLEEEETGIEMVLYCEICDLKAPVLCYGDTMENREALKTQLELHQQMWCPGPPVEETDEVIA